MGPRRGPVKEAVPRPETISPQIVTAGHLWCQRNFANFTIFGNKYFTNSIGIKLGILSIKLIFDILL